MLDDVLDLDALGQAQAIKRGDVRPVDLVEAAIKRIEAVNPDLNAVVSERLARARDEAAGTASHEPPFSGVPLLLKDHLSASAGDPMYEGMRFLERQKWTESCDSYVVAKLRAAGFIILGKTNLPELALLTTTEPVSHGPTRNPWDRTRSVGGSSGGSAAAVAARMVAVAHGTDAGGSIRIPASMCGVVGLKPSRGRVSQGPDHGDVWGNGAWHVHALTRSVRDTAAVLDAIAGYMPGDPIAAPTPARPFHAEVGSDPGRLRIGLMDRPPPGFAELHDECRRAVVETAHLLEGLGHTVHIDHPPVLDEVDEGSAELFFGVAGSGTQWMLDRWARRTGAEIREDDVEPYTWALAQLGRDFTGARLLTALELLTATARRAAVWWTDGYDLLLTPTLSIPPFALGMLSEGVSTPIETMYRAYAVMPFTGLANLTGQPAISLPLHWTATGLPVGVQLIAAYGREDILLRVAAQLEVARPWSDRRPSLPA